MYTLKE